MPAAPGSNDAEALLARLRAYCFPDGEAAARSVRGIRNTQQGEFCTAPGARWAPYTAEESIDATRSGFVWEARMKTGGIRWLGVTDAYEQGRGRLVLKLGGVLPVKKLGGAEVDKGELQRYLALISYCPAILLIHPSLEWSAAGPLTLRVRDREDATGATVDLELREDGRLLFARAERLRLVGSKTVLTPWWAAAFDDREFEGMRVPARFEAGWQLPDGPFPYIRAELTSYEIVR